MEENLFAYPIFALGFLNSNTQLRDSFYALPEEVQQSILQEDIQSEKTLEERIHQHRLME